MTSRDFDFDNDCIEHRTVKKGKATQALPTRCVKPDGFCAISYRGKSFPFFVEIDNANHDNPSFGSEKILPGIAYLQSEEYRTRFGYGSGRFLIVTTGHIRRNNLNKNAVSAIKRAFKGERPEQYFRQFFFSTFDDMNPQSILDEPIWYMCGSEKPVSLLGYFDRVLARQK